MTYYRIINGIRYERNLLESAVAFQKTGNRISEPEIKLLYQQAFDKGTITEVEERTLLYIARNYKLTDNARTWLHETLNFRVPNEVDLGIKSMRKRFGLNNMAVDISPAIVDQYEKNSIRSFESALSDAIEALLHGGINILSLQGIISRLEPAAATPADQRALLLSYLNRGRLYLLSPEEDRRSAMAYDEPDFGDFDNFWIFGFVCPQLEYLVFYSYVLHQQVSSHSRGQFSKKAELNGLVEAVIRRYAAYPNLKWQLPTEEVRQQLAQLAGQNFGNSLFAAVDSGVYNRESSTSMGDAMTQEIWLHPDQTLRQRQFEYTDSGTLYLIPTDFEDNSRPEFTIPEQFSFSAETDWVFGLSMPAQATFAAILTAPREQNDGNIAWSDTFFDEDTPVQQQITQVIEGIFGLEGLQYDGPDERYQQQAERWGNSFQKHPALIRQCIDTLLRDDRPGSALLQVANRDFNGVLDAFDQVQARLKQYLSGGATITLMPLDETEEVAPQGENWSEFWIFRVIMPDLADHYLWVIIARYPEDGQLPYQYWS
jgi:hypothetical protein